MHNVDTAAVILTKNSTITNERCQNGKSDRISDKARNTGKQTLLTRGTRRTQGGNRHKKQTKKKEDKTNIIDFEKTKKIIRVLHAVTTIGLKRITQR